MYEEEHREPGFVEPPTKKPRGFEKIKLYLKQPKKRILVYCMVGLIAIVAVGYFLFFRNNNFSISNISAKKDSPIKEVEMTYEAPLDGVKTDLASSLRHPLGAIIENHPDARPQSGLSKASILYEAMAEGGITRFLAIFGTNEAEKVGPIRSARTYFVDWSRGYSAYLAHVGGNIDALDQIKSESVLDLDQFRYSAAYYRDKTVKVSSEHTVYSATADLRTQAEKNKYTTTNNFKVFTFKDDPAKESPEYIALPESQKVVVDYSSAQYKVTFDYDKATNSYKRTQAGVAHTDRATGAQLNPKNIVVMTVKKTNITTRINEAGLKMDTVGTGKAVIFIDGKSITGTWSKTSKTDREVFLDSNGAEIVFNRGQLMICVIAPDSVLTVDGVKI